MNAGKVIIVKVVYIPTSSLWDMGLLVVIVGMVGRGFSVSESLCSWWVDHFDQLFCVANP